MTAMNRRGFLRLAGSSVIGLTVGGIALRANAQEALDASDATAKALNYTPQSEKSGQNCANCMYIQGNEGDSQRPCAIFPGKLINAQGWCSAWVKRPG